MKIGEEINTGCIGCGKQIKGIVIEKQYRIFGGISYTIRISEHYSKGRKRCKEKYKIIIE